MTDETFQGFGTPEQNWSKLPHALIAALPTIKSASELKVILYILRHTWGFHETEKRISLDEFANGRKRRGGERLDGGTGMSIPAIRNGIKRAIEHGFITVETDDSDRARVKKYYSLNQTVKSLHPDCKKVTPRVQETCNRTKKETIETNRERHVASATPAPDDANKHSCQKCDDYVGRCPMCGRDKPQTMLDALGQLRDNPQPGVVTLMSGAPIEPFQDSAGEVVGEICVDCHKFKATTEEMPYRAETCTCHAKELRAAFGDLGPPPAAEVTPTPHWTEQAAQPWASWGAESDEFQKQLQRFGDSGRIVQELGYKLERATNLKPLWDNKKKVKWWSSGLWELYQEAGCSIPLAIEAAKALKESKMTVTSPYSVANMARALAAEKSQKPKRLVIK